MPQWTWTAACRRGTAHAAAGERRQDAFRIAACDRLGGCIALAACDGAGSASHGGEGASLAAWTLAERARSRLNDGITCTPDMDEAVAWLELARLRVATAAFRRGLPVGSLATTAILVLSNGTSTTVAHIGDGAVAGRETGSGEWLPLSWPEHGEYAATTFFLTDTEPRVRVSRHNGRLDRLAVMTDGLERLALDFVARRPHAPFLDAISAPVAGGGPGLNRPLSSALAEFLDSEKVCSRTDDDKTLLLAALV